MSKLCLDLFSGLGGFSQAFTTDQDWEVYTVDLDPDNRFSPDLTADIGEIGPVRLEARLEATVGPLEEFDTFVILASPPCTQFSIAASRFERIVDGVPQTADAMEDVMLVYHTLGLIKTLGPDWWWLENPQGYLRQIIGEPEGYVTFCQYGADYMKPTDLWGDHPDSFDYRTCNPGDECHEFNTDQAHGGDGNLSTNPAYPRDPAKRAEIPRGLSEAILQSVESPEPQVQSAGEANW